jgi:hypothetical protein
VAEKSPEVIPPVKSILQYNVVLERLLVIILNVVVTPSLTLEAGLLNDTVVESFIVIEELVATTMLLYNICTVKVFATLNARSFTVANVMVAPPDELVVTVPVTLELGLNHEF